MTKIFDKVLIIIRYYNRTNYIIEAIQSALGQTFVNKEVIVIDDGSKESIFDFLLEEVRSQITIVRTTHQGRSAALNHGIKAATNADYVVFLDDDDILHSQMLENAMSLMLKNQYDLVLVGHQYFSGSFNVNENTKEFFLPYGRMELKNLIDGYLLPTINSMLIKKSIIESVYGVDESIDYCEDFDLWLRMAALSPKVGYVNKCLSFIRSHDCNACRDDLRVKEARLSVILKAQSYLSNEQKELVNLDFKIAFRFLITGWYQIAHNYTKEGKRNLALSIKRAPILIFPAIFLWILSFLPKKMKNVLSLLFEILFNRKHGYNTAFLLSR